MIFGLPDLMEVRVEEDGGLVLVVVSLVGLEVDIRGLMVVVLAVFVTPPTVLIELL